MPIIAQASLNNLGCNYIDLFVLAWLILGVFRGRKHGMSQELLPLTQWVAIVILCGMFYQPLAVVLKKNTALDYLLANIFGYLIIAAGIRLVFAWLKKALGEKLVGSDLFGRYEFYLGMVAGAARFACMIVCVIAILNSRIVSQAEMEQTEKMQRQNFEGIRFPTYGSFQHAVLFESFSGRLVKSTLNNYLIASVTPESRGKRDSLAKKQEDQINDILGPSHK